MCFWILICILFLTDGKCSDDAQKWTYSIPLEIIYMTPLSKWNPYDIVYRGDASSEEGEKVYENGRTGTCEFTAYNGVNSRDYYITPEAFFADQDHVISADTVRNTVSVLDSSGTVRLVRNSGFSTQLPDIPDVGKLRQRYPIMPLNVEGLGVWKAMDALTNIILEPEQYKHMLYKNP